MFLFITKNDRSNCCLIINSCPFVTRHHFSVLIHHFRRSACPYESRVIFHESNLRRLCKFKKKTLRRPPKKSLSWNQNGKAIPIKFRFQKHVSGNWPEGYFNTKTRRPVNPTWVWLVSLQEIGKSNRVTGSICLREILKPIDFAMFVRPNANGYHCRFEKGHI